MGDETPTARGNHDDERRAAESGAGRIIPFANEETSCTQHWLLEDPGTFAYWHEQVRRRRLRATTRAATAMRPGTVDDSIRAGLARRLERNLEHEACGLYSSLYANLLGLALWAVDWEQVADALLRAFTEATAEEDRQKHEQAKRNAK
jgi:hypothetical protein